VILVDANVLLYAYDAASERHAVARAWWEQRLSEHEPVRLAWSTVLAFIRIGTHSRATRSPMRVDEACGHVAAWFERPMVDVLEPTPRHWQVLRRLLEDGQAAGNLVTDAHLAALAIEHGATLYTADRDFARFEGLAWRDPCARDAARE
jgi:hypothetical protein